MKNAFCIPRNCKFLVFGTNEAKEEEDDLLFFWFSETHDSWRGTLIAHGVETAQLSQKKEEKIPIIFLPTKTSGDYHVFLRTQK